MSTSTTQVEAAWSRADRAYNEAKQHVGLISHFFELKSHKECAAGNDAAMHAADALEQAAFTIERQLDVMMGAVRELQEREKGGASWR